MRGVPRRRPVLSRSAPALLRGATYAGLSRIANATRIAPSPPAPLPQKLGARGERTIFGDRLRQGEGSRGFISRYPKRNRFESTHAPYTVQFPPVLSAQGSRLAVRGNEQDSEYEHRCAEYEYDWE